MDCSNEDIFTFVPPFLDKLTNLKRLVLNEKILSSVPPSIRKKGEKDVLAYFRDLTAQTSVAFRSAKVMVLGKEGVGKTHLSRRIRGWFGISLEPSSTNTTTGKAYARNMSTDGIDVGSFRFRGMDLTWFDFGGQGKSVCGCWLTRVVNAVPQRSTIRRTSFS